jgi:hypothetical protein
MSQKSSLPQVTQFVSEALMPDIWPSYDKNNIPLFDSSGRCFYSREFDFDNECADGLPITPNEGC